MENNTNKITKKIVTTSVIFTLAILLVLPTALSKNAEASHPRTVSAVTATPQNISVFLDWDRPSSGTTPQDYIIEYKRHSDFTWIRFNDGVSVSTQTTVTGLTNGVHYDFHVAGKKLNNSLLRFSSTVTATPFGSSTPPTPIITQVIPQDHSVVLEWYVGGTNRNSVTDYKIQYKGNWQDSWSNLHEGTSTAKKATVTELHNELTYQFKVASKIGNTVGSFSAVKEKMPTDNCSQLGADGIAKRCYATRAFDMTMPNESTVTGIKGTINFDDKIIPAGFNQASYWVKFTRGEILEVGIHDSSSRTLKFSCAINGIIQNHSFSSSPQNNVNYEMKIEKRVNIPQTWDLIVNGETCATKMVGETSYPNHITRGTETSRNNTPDFTQEFESLKKEKNNSWSYLISSDGTDRQAGLAYDYFIDRCGSGNENIYHIETGKGSVKNC